ncbi:C40 family peptidase [Croceiramulus getboli]|nr:C40 family peptidase [Flavobacteriaceae bacterium YJPT1-3]
MARIAFLFLLALALTSCGSSRKVMDSTNDTASQVVEQARSFAGTPYQYGGTTNRGMDCSGLIHTAFAKENIILPRVSRDMARYGKPVKLKQVEKGDLLFFGTGKNRRRINHVGLVTDVTTDDIYFIHATTSRGVLESSLSERYWNRAFVEAKTVINP